MENITRAPGRAGATVTALFVGVTLVTTTLVGGLTAQRSITELSDRENVVDLAVIAQSSPLPDDAAAQLARLDGVTAVAAVTSTTVTVDGVGERQVVALGADLASVSHDSGAAAAYGPGHLVLASADVEGMLRAGQRVSVTGDRGSRDLTVVIDDRLGFARAMASADLDAVVSSRQTTGVLLRLSARAPLDTTIGEIDRLTATWDTQLGGSAPRRAQIESTLRIVLGVIAGLLALSVGIAFVGVGNTLALSVHERARETALLRALGTTRRQVRRMLALEGALLAGMGTVLGLLAGIAYGIAGVGALIGDQVPLAVDVPWFLLSTLAVGAVVIGVLASALPGRRAALAAPAEVLAQE